METKQVDPPALSGRRFVPEMARAGHSRKSGHRARQERAKAKESQRSLWRGIFGSGGLGMMEFKDSYPGSELQLV